MRFDPTRAAIRFGCGLSPTIAPPANADVMLDLVRGPDTAAKRFPIGGFREIHSAVVDVRKASLQSRKGKTEAERKQGKQDRRDRFNALRSDAGSWFRHTLLRRALTEDGFRERLVFFWADHFTANGKVGPLRHGYMPYVEEAIRPHVAGTFADMLKAVIVHPIMLSYLDQSTSVGPNSEAAKTSRRLSGLNENLAREVMELHTLGVGGPYTQDDVRELAELLTGLWYDARSGFGFRVNLAEPGPETVLGATYGEGTPSLDHIMDVMDDLATHPATGRHLARKLAIHFVSDDPDPELVEALEQQFAATSGDLLAVYEVLLTHPKSWSPEARNVKQPIDFVGSTLRALDLVPRHIPDDFRKLRRHVLGPMTLMGQSWGVPLGPDGWPEADAAWITPQRMAARLQWGMTIPFLLKRLLPDPREFVEIALGDTAPEPVRFAAAAAETRAEGVGIVLASPAFHRM